MLLKRKWLRLLKSFIIYEYMSSLSKKEIKWQTSQDCQRAVSDGASALRRRKRRCRVELPRRSVGKAMSEQRQSRLALGCGQRHQRTRAPQARTHRGSPGRPGDRATWRPIGRAELDAFLEFRILGVLAGISYNVYTCYLSSMSFNVLFIQYVCFINQCCHIRILNCWKIMKLFY